MLNTQLQAIEHVFRLETGRAVATLMRLFGDLSIAEDAVQDAFEHAVAAWTDHVPANPGAWIVNVAKHRALDRLRRETSRGRRELAAFETFMTPELNQEVEAVVSEQLPLIFLCCHPALHPEAQVALTLRLVAGLKSNEIARAFLVPESTMAQRLLRAKRKIQAANIPYRIPEPEDFQSRINAILRVIYLVFNEGYSVSSAGQSPTRSELCAEALLLCRTLLALVPEEPEVRGLLALMLLLEARRPARFSKDQQLIVLSKQDRALWNQVQIAEAQALLVECQRHASLGLYQTQGAINAVHAAAPDASATDWRKIIALYDQLLAIAPNPVVALNRAVAVSEVFGAAEALKLVESLKLEQYYLLHSTRAHLLASLGRNADAAAAYQRASELTENPSERAFLDERRRALSAN